MRTKLKADSGTGQCSPELLSKWGPPFFLCAWVGKKLDERYPSNKNWFTIGFVLFGMVASIYVVLKQLKRFNN